MPISDGEIPMSDGSISMFDCLKSILLIVQTFFLPMNNCDLYGLYGLYMEYIWLVVDLPL